MRWVELSLCQVPVGRDLLQLELTPVSVVLSNLKNFFSPLEEASPSQGYPLQN